MPALIELVNDSSVDEIGNNPGAVHALWTLDGLGALDRSQANVRAVVEASLKHTSAAVRRAGMMVYPRLEESVAVLLESGALEDPNLLNRKAALLTLSELSSDRAAGRAVFNLLGSSENTADRWILDAATAAAAKHDASFIKSVLDGISLTAAPGSELGDGLGRVVRRVTTHYAQRGPVDSIVNTLTSLEGAALLAFGLGGRRNDRCKSLCHLTGADAAALTVT